MAGVALAGVALAGFFGLKAGRTALRGSCKRGFGGGRTGDGAIELGVGAVLCRSGTFCMGGGREGVMAVEPCAAAAKAGSSTISFSSHCFNGLTYGLETIGDGRGIGRICLLFGCCWLDIVSSLGMMG